MMKTHPQLAHNQYIDFGSGRVETRKCYVENNLDLYDELASWTHLNSIIMVESSREINEKTSTEYRFYLSNLQLEPKDFNTFIRQHWGIENNLHWQLDVIFLEDKQRAKSGNAAENFATVRKLALQILNKVQDKESIKNRRKMAGWANEYLAKILHDI